MPGYDKIDGSTNDPSILNNSNDMNGFNILNNDLTSSLTIGVVFEFGTREKMCYFCEE